MQKGSLSGQVLCLDEDLCVILFCLACFLYECLDFVIHRFSKDVYEATLQDSLFFDD